MLGMRRLQKCHRRTASYQMLFPISRNPFQEDLQQPEAGLIDIDMTEHRSGDDLIILGNRVFDDGPPNG